MYDDKDVEKMYKAHASKKQILLWCYSQSTIQKRSTDSQEKSDKVNENTSTPTALSKR